MALPNPLNMSSDEPHTNKAIYTLPGVLNFLQQDWRKFERERNEWQVERSELRSRLAFLEGERKAMETLKSDLVKRVKMLEISLKQERFYWDLSVERKIAAKAQML
jgi:predicted  nucleic acid-binding Zn-ribbon protein